MVLDLALECCFFTVFKDRAKIFMGKAAVVLGSRLSRLLCERSIANIFSTLAHQGVVYQVASTCPWDSGSSCVAATLSSQAYSLTNAIPLAGRDIKRMSGSASHLLEPLGGYHSCWVRTLYMAYLQ